jgi:hypothetical protein
MNDGKYRSFPDRTGFDVNRADIGNVDLLTLLASDRGIASINRPTGAAKGHIDYYYPVPPALT